MTSKFSLLPFTTAFGFAQRPGPPGTQPSKAGFNNVIKWNAYVNNWCLIYINGKLAAADQISFCRATW